jgi:pilus assembly protein FimV
MAVAFDASLCHLITLAPEFHSMSLSMHPKKRGRFNAFNSKTVSTAVVAAMLFFDANAAGLGKLSVLSALGQPLHAEIELTSVGKDEVGTLEPKLASVEAFRQANVELNPTLFSLRFAVEQRGQRHFIRVTSTQPISEPFIDMLVELGGASGRLIREYTFLLDPPNLRHSQSPQSTPPIMLPPAPLARREPGNATDPAAAARRQPGAPDSSTQGVAPAPRRSSTPATVVTPQADQPVESEYPVRRGDTLSAVARQFRGEGVSLDQMLVALYRANPAAFVDNNMNRLRAGQVLSIPDASAAAAIDSSEARRIVVAQTADFNNYRSKLAGQVAASAGRQSDEAAQSATGKITTQVQEQANLSDDAQDKLQLSNSGVAAGADGANAGNADEERIAQQKALQEANARVQELEKNISDLQKLLELKNQQLAGLQQAGGGDQSPVAGNTQNPAAGGAQDPATAEPAPAPAAAAPAPAPAAKPAAKPAAAPAEPGMLERLMDNPLTLPGLAMLAALLGGLGLFALRRRRQQQQFDDSAIGDSRLKENSLFGSTGGQRIDTSSGVFNSNFTPLVSQLDSNEVDPVAEADVYIAYGRDAQAEEILKEALRNQPQRHAVRLKLLEIYANRKDVRSFEIAATELYSLTKGEGDEWKQAATLGKGLDPNNPLYAAGEVAEDNPAIAPPAANAAEPGQDRLLTPTQDPQPAGTGPGAEPEDHHVVSAEPVKQADEAAPQQERPADPNDLDFDLEGLDFEPMAAPNTVSRPLSTDDKASLGEINFDFLDERTDSPAADEPVPSLEDTKAGAGTPPILLDTVSDDDVPMLPSLDNPEIRPTEPELPAISPVTEAVAGTAATDESPVRPSDLPDVVHAHPAAAPDIMTGAQKTEPEPLDFDLSGIKLDLEPVETDSASMQDTYGVHDSSGGDYSNSAEMATKLDLAVAYQEIGDKEGARELLEEVIRGGAPEQAEKARALLDKLA